MRWIALIVMLFIHSTDAWARFTLINSAQKVEEAQNELGTKKERPNDPSNFSSKHLEPTISPVNLPNTTPAPIESWMINANDGTLRRALSKWATRAGWQLQWEATVDVPITVTAAFEGDFRTAINKLFGSLSASEVNLAALMYTGNKVLRVTETGRRAQ